MDVGQVLGSIAGVMFEGVWSAGWEVSVDEVCVRAFVVGYLSNAFVWEAKRRINATYSIQDTNRF
jgi:hypothetical protein